MHPKNYYYYFWLRTRRTVDVYVLHFGANVIKLVSVERDDIWVLMFAVGDDEQSTKLVESFNDAAVSQLIVNANCVALQLPVNR